MSVYYRLATMKMELSPVTDKYVATITPVSEDVYADLGVPEQELHYSTVLPDLLGIPDTGEGMFLPPDSSRYFMGCISRLDQAPRTKSYYLSDEYYDRVRWFIQVWMALPQHINQPVYLVWS